MQTVIFTSAGAAALPVFTVMLRDPGLLSAFSGTPFSVGFPAAWYFMFILLDLSLLAWVKMNFGASFLRTIEASFNFQTAVRMYNDNSQLQRQLDSILNFFYFLNGAFMMLILENQFRLYPFGQEGFLLFLINFTALSAYYLLRSGLVRIAGHLFNRANLFREYSYHVSNYNKIIGLAIAPFIILLIYLREDLRIYFLYLVIILLLSVYILRIIRGLIFSWKRDVFILYMFLYLCALEIAPLLLLFKWMESAI
ncbi:MAG: DUF4271 domain-containing protein [Bacteroidota bacterium]